jgi:hypothetical protein
MFKSENSLDTIRENLTNFFVDLVAFFQKVFNFVVDAFNGMPGAATDESTSGEDTSV